VGQASRPVAGRETANDLANFAAAAFPVLSLNCRCVNVGGNKNRIAAFVHYRKQIVYIKKIGAHKGYDKSDL
jgi:mRNA-degrading endonuclease HigB of HigAB toxin-antitoxin module